MAKKKKIELALSGAISQFLQGNTTPARPPTVDSDLKRTLQKYRAPEKVERLERELAATRSGLAAIKRRLAPGEKHILRILISTVKKNHRDRASDQRYIARQVDMILEKKQMVLADICPKTWKVRAGLPDRLLEALRDNRWKGPVAQYISKSPPC